MFEKASGTCGVIGLVLVSGCLGPNPRLKKCGETWAVTTAGATGEHLNSGERIAIRTHDDKPVTASRCLAPMHAAQIEDPNSLVYTALRADALLACQARADVLQLVDDDCEDHLSPPSYVSSCLVHKNECDGGGETGGETGDAAPAAPNGFKRVKALVHCDGDTCTVDQALIDAVLDADAATFAADGTVLSPHRDSTGRQDGWELGGITRSNLGAALGFENGDVVTRVGDEPVDGWATVVRVANAALHANAVTLEFTRGGRRQERRFVRGR